MLGSTAPKRVSRGDNSDLSAHIAACLHELVDQGYAKLTIDMYRGSLGHFSYWVTRDKIKWRGHEEASIRRFLTTHLPSCDCIGRHQHDRWTIVQLIAATTTDTGLKVRAVLDENKYPKGVKVSDAKLAAVNLSRHSFHGDWNYTISPSGKTSPGRKMN